MSRLADAYARLSPRFAHRPPAWWPNPQAGPEAEAMVGNEWHRVQARKATDAEREELWPRFVAMYRGYDHYEEIATREMPVVVLEPRA